MKEGISAHHKGRTPRMMTVKEDGPDPVDVYVGKRIQLRRSLIGMTQNQLAKSIGVSFQQVQKYERGFNRVSASKLYHVAKTLQVSISFFFEDFDEAPSETAGETPVAKLADPMHETASMMLVQDFRKLPEAQRARLLDLVRAMRHG